VEELLDWHLRNKRDFPWRRGASPYQLLIAEMLLTKTNAEKVEEVFEDFIASFPTPTDLAEADLASLHRKLRPLGLWRVKAKSLRRLGRELRTRYDGMIPREKSELLKLPGVGEYISSAIATQAFGASEVASDVNVSRVLGRVFSGNGMGIEQAARLAKRIVPKESVLDFNQSLLDFGALVCGARNPLCPTCPFSRNCEYYKRKRTGQSASM